MMVALKKGAPIYVDNFGHEIAGNGQNVPKYIITSLRMFSEELDHDKFPMFLSDAASYMKVALGVFRKHIPIMINVTCLAHRIDRVVSQVHHELPPAVDLMGKLNTIFYGNTLRQINIMNIRTKQLLPR